MKRFLSILTLWFFLNRDCNPIDLIVWKETADSLILDKYTIQKIFTKQITKWPNGQTIHVFIKPINSIEHKDFVINVLGLSPYYYNQILDRQLETNKLTSVTEIPTDKQMTMKVESTPGGIGYINYEIITNSKTVTVVNGNDVK